MVGTKEGAAKSPWVQRLREMSATLQAQKLAAAAKATAKPKKPAKQCKHECSDKPPPPG
jgi:hypothetical protein